MSKILENISLLEKDYRVITSTIENITELFDTMRALNISLSIQIANGHVAGVKKGLEIVRKEMDDITRDFEIMKDKFEDSDRIIKQIQFDEVTKMIGE